MHQPARRFRTTLASVVLLAHLANYLVPAAALAQGGSASNVQRGQEYYEQSRFDEAIGLLKDLVDRGALTGADLQHARELLARSYVKKGYPVQGKEMFKGILRGNPQWRPDPIRVPPDETAVFEQALKEYTAEAAGGTPPAPGDAAPAPGAPPSTAPTTPAPVTPPPATPPPARPTPTPASSMVPSASKPESGKKSNKTIWYIVGGAVVLGGVAAAAAGGGGGGDGPPPRPALAAFPGPPTP